MTKQQQQSRREINRENNRKTNRPKNHVAPKRMLATAAAATLAGLAVAPPPAAHATIRINEAFIDAPGTNSTQDFIELINTDGGVISIDDLTMVMLEGDAGAAGGSGIIDHVVSFAGQSTGANGLFLRHSFAAGPAPAIAADTAVQNLGYAHENAGITWLLVSGFTGATMLDLDPDDDGTLDNGGNALPWTSVVDAVSVFDGNVANDRVYASLFGGPEFNENSMGTANAVFRDQHGALHAAAVTGAVGGPYATSGGFTAETGYELSPGNPNNATAANARGWVAAAPGGAWNTGANWTGGAAPVAAGDVAKFTTAGNASISLSADASVGVLSFEGGNHTIAAGGGTLTLDTLTGSAAQILVQSGNPVISAPVMMNQDTNIRIGRAMTVQIDSLNANGKILTKQGIGQLILPGGLPNAATINITSGSIRVPSDGSFNRVIAADTLTMSGTTSRIDLGDNKLVTNTAAGTQTGGIYTGVQGMVQKAYNFSAWDGQGVAITTSMPDALGGLTTIGVASAEQILFLAPTDTGTWAGQTVTGATTLAMYTYAGDANLDGLVDAADYGAIDNFVQFPGTDGYANGDFNYDGVIDAGDYGIIDNTIQLQGAPIPNGGPAIEGVTAVPEPTAAAACGLALLTLAARRRRQK